MKTKVNLSSTELFIQINQHWLLLLLMGLTGALLSVVISLLFIRPVYISSSQTSIGINFKEIGHLSQYDQDQYIGLVEALFLSDEVMQDTLSFLAARGISLTQQEFITNRMLERKSNLIILKYKSTDNQSPQWITSAWNQVALEHLTTAYEHALTYQRYRNLQNSYLICFQNSVQYPAAANCEWLQTQIPATQTILEEKVLSRGIFPGISFFLVNEEASFPIVIRHQTNILVLSGFFIGLILGIIILLFAQKKPASYEISNS